MSPLSDLIRMKYNPPKDTKPSFKGRNVLITGASSGLGFEAALKFVQLGADRVVFGVRSVAKGKQAKEAIEARTGRRGCVDIWTLDMADYGSIKAFTNRVETELNHLDVAVLNAGVLLTKYEQSKHGWEQTLQVNLLSTVLLSLLLLPKLRASKSNASTPVLELVSSSNHTYLTSLKAESDILNAYNSEKGYAFSGQYDTSKLFVQYAQAGLCELAKPVSASKPDVYIVTVCPGFTKSSLSREIEKNWALRPVLAIASLLQRSTEEGARTYISGVAEAEKAHGRFWRDDEVQPPAVLLRGDKGQEYQRKVWDEIVASLSKDVPEVQKLVTPSYH
ncbi:hypothetical protein BAUCODRAFT_80931 [Baudoinia panamericana UAMH 10762]|uniref:Uncharacterized protein n=1 Tax=Baudoinia panamericana (strain UAMH 10762) TaxID=717646 RepID=M2NLS8_BAUPA|nr:uncharacterized protein BAUCODRAFT_80931 [Baudoinia panamericana UAMH 10762]EMD00450.1 hypothetical protein BAUCODRAFT_80931 [Baudoinia panamericana UAMH 10762]